MTKYSDNAKWLEPFVRSARRLVPVERLTSVHGYRIRKGYEARCYGSMFKDGSTYSINILMEDWSKREKVHHGQFYELILDSLAHELAHMVYFHHPPEHYRLKCKIMLGFSKILKKQGIKDHSKEWEKR